MERKKERQEKNETALSLGVEKFGEWMRRAGRRMLSLTEEIHLSFWEAVDREGVGLRYPLVKATLTVAFFAAVLALATILSLTRFPLKVYPVGFALLCAIGGAGKWRSGRLPEKKGRLLDSALWISVFCGVILSPLFLDEYAFVYALMYFSLFLGRGILTRGRFDESLLARITFSSAIATATGLILAILDRFTVNRIFAATSFGILTPLISYLLCGFYIFTAANAVGEGARTKKKVYLEASFFTLVYLFLYAIREVQWMQFSLSLVLSVIFTLAMAKERGALYGAGMGMICGMASAASPVAPALAVAGFFSGLFFEYSVPVAMMVSFVSACGYSMYSEGFRAFGLVTADFIAGLVLFLPVSRWIRREEKELPLYPKKDLLHRETMRQTRQKLKTMSDAFSSLSEVFYTVSDSMKKPQLTEVSRLVSDCCSEVCSRCTLSGICWGKEHGLHVDATSRVSSRLLLSGQIETEHFGEPFASGCKNLEELTALVNRRYEDLNGSFFKNNKTRLLAGEYSSVSRLLKSTAGELNQELEYNPSLEARAKKVLRSLGLNYRRVAVFGTREIKIDVYGILLERVSLASDQVIRGFEREFHCLFDGPNFLMFEESVVMRLRRKRKFSLECSKSGCAKKGESISGDSVAFFETERDYFYTLICDGMGSGREAAFTSRLSAIFIEKLMHCATPKNVTLEMLNAFLMAKTDETFTTVDLLEIDLLSGEANFMKAGAAPSFVLRKGSLHRIESRTPPAGALHRTCAEQTAFSLQHGDYIIQISDGVEEIGQESSWLVELLCAVTEENAGALCDLIFQKAKEMTKFRDDLSVSVVRVMNSK